MKKLKLFSVALVLSAMTIGGAAFAKSILSGHSAPHHAKAEESTFLSKDYASASLDPADDTDIVLATNVAKGKIDGAGQDGIIPANPAGVNYIVYKITAPEGEVFETLNLVLSGGRFAYYVGDYGNYLSFYVSDDAGTIGTDPTLVQTFNGSGTALTTLSADASTLAASYKANVLYVGFMLGTTTPGCGYDATWTCLYKFDVTGTSKASVTEKTYLEKDYATASLNSDDDLDIAMVANVSKGKIDGAGQDGIIPATPASGANYIVYRIAAEEGMVFDTLTLTLSGGRFAYYVGDYGNYLSFYVSDDLDKIGTDPTTLVKKFEGSGTALSTLSADASTLAASYKANVLFVGFMFGTTTEGCGYDASWTCLYNFKAVGTEVEKPEIIDPTVHEYTVKDVWNNGTSTASSNNATEVINIGCDGNVAHGAIVGTWGGTLSVDAEEVGSFVYKLGKEGEIITNATFGGIFRFTNMSNETIHWGDKIDFEVSIDGENWQKVERLGRGGGDEIAFEGAKVGGAVHEYVVDSLIEIFAAAQDKIEFLYVKISMVHLLALENIPLDKWGTATYQTYASYKTKDGKFIRYDVDGGTLPDTTRMAFLEDEAVYTLPTPTREGYTFLGWYDADENKVESFDPAGDTISVKAKWELLNTSHTITYVGVDGITNTNPETISETGEDVTLVDVSKTGYTFLGWFDAAEGGNKVTTLVASETTEDVTLYAHWEEKEYTITYQLGEHISLDQQPAKIKFTQKYEYLVSVTDDYYLDCVKVNGKIVELNELGKLVISGSLDKDIVIAISEYKLGNVKGDTLEGKYSTLTPGEFAFASDAYDFVNLKIVDSPNHVGLATEHSGTGEIVYKFEAGEGKVFNGIEVSGSARIFDLDGKASGINLFISLDGVEFDLIKAYAPANIQDGEAMVNLGFLKQLSEKVNTLFIKVQIERLGEPDYAADWVVVENIKITLESEDDPAAVELKQYKEAAVKALNDHYQALLKDNTYSDANKAALLAAKDAAVAAINSATSKEAVDGALKAGKDALNDIEKESVTPTPTPSDGGEETPSEEPAKKKGCGGSVVAASALISLTALIGAGLLISKKRKDQ